MESTTPNRPHSAAVALLERQLEDWRHLKNSLHERINNPSELNLTSHFDALDYEYCDERIEDLTRELVLLGATM